MHDREEQKHTVCIVTHDILQRVLMPPIFKWKDYHRRKYISVKNAPFPLLGVLLHSGTGLLVSPVTRQVEVAVPFIRYPELHENIMASLMLNGLVTSPDTWPLGIVGRGHVTTGEQQNKDIITLMLSCYC